MENKGKMPVAHRAKQFMPFSALTGLEEALKLKEKEMRKVSRPEISEEKAEMINAEFLNLDPGDRVIIRYFKDGEIFNIGGIIENIDMTFRRINIGGIIIKTDDIVDISRVS